jgi:large conductance mechanosensitive channel
MLNEFRDFIMRGNVLDLAVGIIIGAAFTSIVNSLVNDIIMPPIGLVIGGIDFSEIAIVLRPEVPATATAEAIPAVTMNIGLFINALISFLIIAFVVFLIVKGFNEMMRRLAKQKEEGTAPVEPTVEEKMLKELQEMNTKLANLQPK